MRKEPRQARSRATVDAVVEAGARILSEQGWGGFTTNKVADAAGVSIGSLYQYFPDKLSLVDAIRRRHIDDSLAAVRGALAETQSLVAFVETLVANIIEAHSIHPGLHRVLLDEAPGLEAYRDQNSQIEAQYLALYTEAASAYEAQDRGVPAATVGLVISDAIDGVIHNAARRGRLREPQLRDELVRMICSYLADRGEVAVDKPRRL
ncbi:MULTISPECIES: TetR/AcrR family transcriptional regulator [unclassified Bosea (in: a-proteobacteria)]|uniref:TetR/AcrR family transcriptional regulator n=1 Tax=unclassified Bosea (in: a-proteobacteria) TaxID=2653178 RepID=UPI000F75C1A4|nr:MULTISPECIES: TetR/AcrR family transcriptional regulator [unclassified Bosea (in: a-proteobacteria)]AZO76389.1 TetR family transcriptional regulator [Bosea sp. Tri-49]RXT26316.1 TetR family transcriptional regulator [Bosea sp. Tri-39]RXT31557.1 TetR family transcriptional regulator [Bosea sp. Tri-54]